jgi:hypothetical protein
MGGFCTQSTTTLPDPKSVLSGTQIPEWVSAAGRQLYEQSAEMAGSEFPTYTGQRIASYGDVLDAQGNKIQVGVDDAGNPIFQQSKLTPEEIEAGRLLSEGADAYQPYIDDATAIAGELGRGFGGASREELLGERFTAETAQPYVDIFQRSVDPAIEER